MADPIKILVEDFFDHFPEAHHGNVDRPSLTEWAGKFLQGKAHEPIPMVLHCPECKGRHIDEGDFATKPHHTHACQHCGMVWRPAIVPTVGVQFLPGFKNAD